MPSNVVKSFADKTGKTVKEVEKYWDKAEEIAKEKFSPDSKQFYAYLVGTLKKMLGIKTTQSEELLEKLNSVLENYGYSSEIEVEKGTGWKEVGDPYKGGSQVEFYKQGKKFFTSDLRYGDDLYVYKGKRYLTMDVFVKVIARAFKKNNRTLSNPL